MSRRDYSTAGGLMRGCHNPYEDEGLPDYQDRCYNCGVENPSCGWSEREYYDEETNELWLYCNECAPVCQWCEKDASENPGLEWASPNECLECAEYMEE